MLQGSLHLFLRILLIPKLAAEITIIGLQIEVSLSAEVEDDDIFFLVIHHQSCTNLVL